MKTCFCIVTDILMETDYCDEKLSLGQKPVAPLDADPSGPVTASLPSSDPHPSLQRAALWPAIVWTRKALLSQWRQDDDRPSLDRLDGLVGYLARIPGLHLCELEPILMWKHGVGDRCVLMCYCMLMGDGGVCV